MPDAPMPAGERVDRPRRYGLLLATLIAFYLLSALAIGRPGQSGQLVLVAAVTLLALRNTDFPHRKLARWAALAGSVLAIAGVASFNSPVARGTASLWTGILLLGTVVIIVDSVLKLDTVTLQSIYGALSAYMLVGLMFAAFFGAIDGLGGTDFFVNGEAANIRTYQYFSFTTLTTLGYGDFTAGGSFGRAVAVLEALTGQIFLVTLVARLVSAYRGPTRRDPPPPDSADGGTVPPQLARQARRRLPRAQHSPTRRTGHTRARLRPPVLTANSTFLSLLTRQITSKRAKKWLKLIGRWKKWSEVIGSWRLSEI